eukprot:scaffold324048_cov30-Prasinocladus_malaysianus.AAC.1
MGMLASKRSSMATVSALSSAAMAWSSSSSLACKAEHWPRLMMPTAMPPNECLTSHQRLKAVLARKTSRKPRGVPRSANIRQSLRRKASLQVEGPKTCAPNNEARHYPEMRRVVCEGPHKWYGSACKRLHER